MGKIDLSSMWTAAIVALKKGNYDEFTKKITEWALISGFRLIIGFIIIFIGFKISKSIVKRVEKILLKKDVDVTIIRFFRSLITGIIKIGIVASVVMGIWGIELAGFSAVLTTAGVAIGLALQGSLSNFAGGFIILLLRPFKVGDYILTAGYEGTVEQIGVFYTNLATIDNKLVLIPNGTISNGSLINYSAKETRRVDFKFGVSYESDILHVRKVLAEIVNEHKLIIHKPEPFIGIIEHSPSAITFGVRVWCKNSDYWKIYFELLETVKLRFDEEEINIPYPQMELNIKNALEKSL